MSTAPWLESAFVLDSKLLELSGRLAELGLPTEIKSNDDLMVIMEAIKKEVVAKIRLWEFYVLDVDYNAEAAVNAWLNKETYTPEEGLDFPGDIGELAAASLEKQVEFVTKFGQRGTDRLGERFRRKIDPKLASSFLSYTLGGYESNNGPDKAAAKAKIVQLLDILNVEFYKEYDAEVDEKYFSSCSIGSNMYDWMIMAPS
uniref:Glycogen debranching enzyme glucanotransferase domain-containing protein n=1 Tax=Bionectria ochroleuca TaxID=29856 RepID=A0A8H7KAB4_BIOOC